MSDVLNQLIVCGENAGNIMRQFVSVNDDEGTEFFDFNKVIETPPELLAIERGSSSLDTETIEDNRKSKNESEEAVKVSTISDLYDWRLRHWGTMQNSYDTTSLRIKPDRFFTKFYTAWYPPFFIIEKLAKSYPRLSINLKYKDELYNYSGYCKFANGRIESKYVFPMNKLEDYKKLFEKRRLLRERRKKSHDSTSKKKKSNRGSNLQQKCSKCV